MLSIAVESGSAYLTLLSLDTDHRDYRWWDYPSDKGNYRVRPESRII